MAEEEHASRLVSQLLRRERWLLALAAVRCELLSGGTVGDALQLIADRSAALTDADGVIVLLVDGKGLKVWAASGARAQVATGPTSGVTVPLSDPWVAAVTDALGAYSAHEFPAPRQPELAALWRGIDSVLIASIPAGVGDGGLVICLRAAGRDPFQPDQQPELVGLAEQASIALEVADRQEQRRLYELMADRERIARDLHDHVIQRLFAVGLSLQSQVAKIEAGPARDRVDQAVQQIDEAIADLRSSIFNLRSVPHDQRKNLRRRLSDIVAGVGDSGPRVTLRCHGPVDTIVSPELSEHAEAVVREAVSNAVRHSGGTSVTVSVTASDRLDIEITDNGRAIEKDVTRSGLDNLAKRAASCGGSFEAVGGKGGTTVRWTAPLPSS